MRKTIMTVFAFMILFGLAVSGAMAQTWTWEAPALIDNVDADTNVIFFTEFEVDSANVLQGWDDSTSAWIPVSYPPGTGGAVSTNVVIETVVDSVAVPPFVVIDEDTVGIFNGPSYLAVADQPLMPELPGKFTHIAAQSDGTLYYVIFEANDGAQYVLAGGPDSQTEWEEATARFTPRSLNLGSNGKWVTCKVSAIDGYTWDQLELANLCIIGINDELIAIPVCVDPTTSPSNINNSSKLMVKFNRRLLADAIALQHTTTTNPDLDKTITKITLAYSDETINFYDDDTIKTKPAKVKNHKK
jgi:hypothetical protein